MLENNTSIVRSLVPREQLPDYKDFAHLKDWPISIIAAASKYSIHTSTSALDAAPHHHPTGQEWPVYPIGCSRCSLMRKGVFARQWPWQVIIGIKGEVGGEGQVHAGKT